jgi:hypothetical protein
MTGFYNVDGEDAWHTVLIEWLPGRTGRGGDALSRLMDRLSIEVSWHKLFWCVVGFHWSFHIAICRSCPKRWLLMYEYLMSIEGTMRASHLSAIVMLK